MAKTAEIEFAPASQLSQDLTERYGPVLADEDLREVLGYRTSGALRQALARGAIDVPVFRLPQRRGHYALAKDVAIWLVAYRDLGQVRKGSSGSGGC